MKQTTGGAGDLCRAPNQLLKTQRGSKENEWRRQIHADTQWYCWAPKEKLGIFNFREDKGDCFLSSVVALRKQNRNQERNMASGKAKKAKRGWKGWNRRKAIVLLGNNLNSLECPEGLGTILCVRKRLGSPWGDMKWEMNIINHPYLLHVRKRRGSENEWFLPLCSHAVAARELGLTDQSLVPCEADPWGSCYPGT